MLVIIDNYVYETRVCRLRNGSTTPFIGVRVRYLYIQCFVVAYRVISHASLVQPVRRVISENEARVAGYVNHGVLLD